MNLSDRYIEDDGANAAYIALAHPGAILELLDDDDRKEQAMADAYQAVACLIDLAGMTDHPEAVRILDVLAYGKTEDGIDLLPWPKDKAVQKRLREANGLGEMTVE